MLWYVLSKDSGKAHDVAVLFVMASCFSLGRLVCLPKVLCVFFYFHVFSALFRRESCACALHMAVASTDAGRRLYGRGETPLLRRSTPVAVRRAIDFSAFWLCGVFREKWRAPSALLLLWWVTSAFPFFLPPLRTTLDFVFAACDSTCRF